MKLELRNQKARFYLLTPIFRLGLLSLRVSLPRKRGVWFKSVCLIADKCPGR